MRRSIVGKSSKPRSNSKPMAESAALSAPKSRSPKAQRWIDPDFPEFDIENPELPVSVADAALQSGGFPYDKRLKDDKYLKELNGLQIELLKLQRSIADRKERVVMVIEGRDAAGKGGLIAAMAGHLNPRHAHVVALSKPTDVERGQWYFQRYVAELPTAGDITIFDRSWYNRAGVEQVMGFCTPEQHADFLRDAPAFEGLLVGDGIKLIKLYLTIGRATQLKRLHSRHHDPLKQWKLTQIDLDGLTKWDDYTSAQIEMFHFTHVAPSPWTVVRANDKYRARLNAIRHVLSVLDYADKDVAVVGAPDPLIVGTGPGFFD
jgi:polyphosphate kinase